MKNKLKKLRDASVVVTVTVTLDWYENEDDYDTITSTTGTSYEFNAADDTDWEGASYRSFLMSIVGVFADYGVKFSAVCSDPTQAHWAESEDGVYCHPYTYDRLRTTVKYDMTYSPFAKHAVAITDKLTADIVAGVEAA